MSTRQGLTGLDPYWKAFSLMVELSGITGDGVFEEWVLRVGRKAGLPPGAGSPSLFGLWWGRRWLSSLVSPTCPSSLPGPPHPDPRVPFPNFPPHRPAPPWHSWVPLEAPLPGTGAPRLSFGPPPPTRQYLGGPPIPRRPLPPAKERGLDPRPWGGNSRGQQPRAHKVLLLSANSWKQ